MTKYENVYELKLKEAIPKKDNPGEMEKDVLALIKRIEADGLHPFAIQYIGKRKVKK